MNRTLIIITAALLGAVVASAGEAWAQTAAPPDKRVYTVCTLLVGQRDARPATGSAAGALKTDGSTMTMFVGRSNPLTQAESVQVGEDLADLQEKLMGTFQLEQIEAVASLGDWMPVGREMLLQGPGTGLKLIVTASGVRAGANPPFVATTPRGGGEPSDYERGYVAGAMAGSRSAEYKVRLTTGATQVFDRSMTVALGQRSVFARQPQPNGPVYFVVVAAPLMETRAGIALGGVVGELDRPIRGPKLLSGPDPLLPPEARRAGAKGAVILTATIGADGLVHDVKVVQAVEGVTERAVAALRLRRYEPAVDENGRPIAVQIAVRLPSGDAPDA
jgi:TonB family protein